ncbi:hypothetical protein [Humisphaera borealis]|uniref:Uncharacterized protein n=1 Tax=Humisphaera borealis TaxID=2807512 RepID=A0A7M2WTX0_9BACT|nr:hypothetical protein [Humisphaera borealis]QOV88926.1 hypothetical protein IPV69_22280 [Humisphaera borealis]
MPIVLGVCAIIATLILNAVWSRLPYNWVCRLRQVVVSVVVGSLLTGFLLVAGALLGSQLGLSGIMKDLLFYIAILVGIALGISIIWRSHE